MKAFTISKGICAFLVSGIIFLTIACTKDTFPDPNTLTKELKGTWVEVNTKTDTIIFNSNADTGIFWLHRGYEIRNGYRLPIIGSTGYHYEICKDSIKLIDGLSSLWNESTYYFNFDKPNLTIHIGNFSRYIATQRSILTFRKIK